ncbi:hypothetical protein [Burkholderia territorii]
MKHRIERAVHAIRN